MFGVMATFNTTRDKDALPLSTGQKYQLFFKSATDPWPFVLTAFGAGIDQAENSFPEYGQGVEGYAKRWGAALYRLLSPAICWVTRCWQACARRSALFSERHRQLSPSRLFGRQAGTVWCKRDNGSWGPNYANVLGNLMGAAVSNLYYPASERTVGEHSRRGFTVTAKAIIGSEVIEFWPDMVRHHRRKQAEKLARQGGKESCQEHRSGLTPPLPCPAALKAPYRGVTLTTFARQERTPWQVWGAGLC